MFRGMPILQKLRTMVARASVTAPGPDAAPVPTGPTHFGFVLGTHTVWPDDVLDDAEPVEEQFIYTPATDGHLLLTGDPGTGKTLLLGALAGEAAADMEVHTVDGWGSMDKLHALQPKQAATIGFTPAECTTMLEIVLAEVQRRAQQCELEGVGVIGDLQDPPRRILVILDDARHLLVDDDYSRSGDGQSKARSVECIEEIAASAELAGVTLVLSSQWSPDESGLPAKILEGQHSSLDLKTEVHDFGNGPSYVAREGYWQPSGQSIGRRESLLVMQERKDGRPLV